MHAHDCVHLGHDKDLHVPLLIADALVGRTIQTMRSGPHGETSLQALEGPGGTREPFGMERDPSDSDPEGMDPEDEAFMLGIGLEDLDDPGGGPACFAERAARSGTHSQPPSLAASLRRQDSATSPTELSGCERPCHPW